MSTTDAEGFTISYEYDAFGEVTRITEPEGGVVEYSYTAEGQLQTMTQPDGGVVTLDYDANLNVAGITHPDGTRTTHGYNATNLPTQIVLAAGTPVERVQTFGYDDLNRMTARTDALGASETYEYDAVGNMIRFTDKLGRDALSDYDEMERLFATLDPATGESRIDYTNGEEQVTLTDALGRADIVLTDDVGRHLSTQSPDGAVRTSSYDLQNQQVAATDALGNTFSYEYDILGRAVADVTPSGFRLEGAYDGRGQVTEITDGRGEVETFTYDGNGRMTRRQSPQNDITFAYDPEGKVVSVVENDSDITRSYDAMDRVVTETVNYPTFGRSLTLTFSYDALGQITQVADSFGGVTRYDYDAQGGLVRLEAPWGAAIDYTIAADRRVLSRVSTAGVASRALYDTGGRISRLTHDLNGAVFSGEEFSYALNGKIELIRDLVTPALSRSLSRDVNDRLVQVSQGVPAIDGGTPVPVEDYQYDAEDNRIASHLSALHRQGADHQILETDSHLFTYDGNGHRETATDKATGEVLTFGYNEAFQLTSVQSSVGWSEVYAYDGQNRRSRALLTRADATLRETVFFYLGHNLFMSFTDDNGVQTARRWTAGHRKNAYRMMEVYGPGAAPTPGSGTSYEIILDYRDNVIALVDVATGSLASEYTYDAYGNRTVLSETVDPGIGFGGYYEDRETGLKSTAFRAYDPVTGHFLQPDPMGFVEGTMNTYAYVGSQPMVMVDPFGLTATPSWAVLTADKPTNDAYPNAIFGAVFSYLLRQMEEAFEGLDELYKSFQPGVGFTEVEPFEALIQFQARCRSFETPYPSRPALPLPPERSHGGGDHTGAIAARIAWLVVPRRQVKMGFVLPTLKMNQRQVNAAQMTVSTCRPDIQYNYWGGKAHMLEEFFWPGNASKEWAKAMEMIEADPWASYLGFPISKGRR